MLLALRSEYFPVVQHRVVAVALLPEQVAEERLQVRVVGRVLVQQGLQVLEVAQKLFYKTPKSTLENHTTVILDKPSQ